VKRLTMDMEDYGDDYYDDDGLEYFYVEDGYEVAVCGVSQSVSC
jgi:hypothetical protein